MRIVINQFTNIDELQVSLSARFDSNSSDAQALFAFLDDVKVRMRRMQSVGASIQLEKKFKIGNETVSLRAATVHGFIPTLWSRLFG